MAFWSIPKTSNAPAQHSASQNGRLHLFGCETDRPTELDPPFEGDNTEVIELNRKIEARLAVYRNFA